MQSKNSTYIMPPENNEPDEIMERLVQQRDWCFERVIKLAMGRI